MITSAHMNTAARNNSTPRIFGAATVLLFLSGCFNTVYIAGEGAFVTTQSTGGASGESFHVKTWHRFYLWGRLPRTRVIEVDKAVSEALGRDVKYITSLKLRGSGSTSATILRYITFGIYIPQVLVIEGRAHETKPALPPIPSTPSAK